MAQIDNSDLKFNFGCSSCGYKKIREGQPLGRIDVRRIIEKLDVFFAKNDMGGAGRLLEYQRAEAVRLCDLEGELSIVNEMLGYYRKVNNKEKGMEAVERSLELIALLKKEESVSSATVFLNAATTMKAFGNAKDALLLYDKTENIYKDNLEPHDERFGGFYNNKALALVDMGEYKRAEECYLSALDIMINIEGGQPDMAVTYVNMAHMYEVADSDMVNVCLENAYNILKGDIRHDSYYAFVCTKCAPSFEYFGKVTWSEELLTEAKKIYERT